VTKAKPSPKFTDASGNQVGILVEIGSRRKSPHFFPTPKTFQVQNLTPGDFLENLPDFTTILITQLFEPFQNPR